MHQLDVRIPSSEPITCPIYISDGDLGELAKCISFESYSSFGLVIDESVSSQWIDSVLRVLPRPSCIFTMPSGERQKSLDSIERLWRGFMEARLDRRSLLICIGGGATLDAGAFAASTYMRGIPFLHVPTTLLAQVDASIGGKSSINIAGIKNFVGTFAQPKAVLINTEFLRTLPRRELLSGFSEIIKHGVIADRTHLDELEELDPNDSAFGKLVPIITHSVMIKRAVVERDPFEEAWRKILNFGHTIGHAIESLSLISNKPLLHGEAISIGMACEARLSELLGRVTRNEVEYLEKTLDRFSLPIRYTLDVDAIVELIALDKKNERQRIRWTLLRGLGAADVNCEADSALVREAILYGAE